MPVMNSRQFSLYDRWRGAFGRWMRLAKWLNTVARALNRAHSLSPFCSLQIGPDGGLEHDMNEKAMLRASRRMHPWMIDETADGHYYVHGGRVWHAPGGAASVSGQDIGTSSGDVVLCSIYSGTASETHSIVAGTSYPLWVSLDPNTWRVATPLGRIASGTVSQWQHSDILAPMAPARAAVRFGDIPDELDAQFAYQDGVNQFDSTADVAVRFDIKQDGAGENVQLRGRIRDFSSVAETHIDWTKVSQTIIQNSFDYTNLYNTLVQYFDWTSISETVIDALGLIRGQVVVDVFDGTTHIKFGHMGGLVDDTRADSTVIEIGECTNV